MSQEQKNALKAARDKVTSLNIQIDRASLETYATVEGLASRSDIAAALAEKMPAAHAANIEELKKAGKTTTACDIALKDAVSKINIVYDAVSDHAASPNAILIGQYH